MSDILTINMQSCWTECFLCDAETPKKWGIWTYEGLPLSNDFQGERFGHSVCFDCHQKHERGEIKTYDLLELLNRDKVGEA